MYQGKVKHCPAFTDYPKLFIIRQMDPLEEKIILKKFKNPCINTVSIAKYLYNFLSDNY